MNFCSITCVYRPFILLLNKTKSSSRPMPQRKHGYNGQPNIQTSTLSGRLSFAVFISTAGNATFITRPAIIGCKDKINDHAEVATCIIIYAFWNFIQLSTLMTHIFRIFRKFWPDKPIVRAPGETVRCPEIDLKLLSMNHIQAGGNDHLTSSSRGINACGMLTAKPDKSARFIQTQWGGKPSKTPPPSDTTRHQAITSWSS